MTRSNGWKPKPEKFQLEIRYKFLTVRVINLWNSLLGYVMDSPWFDFFKLRMRVFLRNTPAQRLDTEFFELRLHDLGNAGGQPIVSKEIKICESEPRHDPLVPSSAFKFNPDPNSPSSFSLLGEIEGIF